MHMVGHPCRGIRRSMWNGRARPSRIGASEAYEQMNHSCSVRDFDTGGEFPAARGFTCVP